MIATIKKGEPVYPPPTYVLELSEDEAQVLFALTGVVHGAGHLRNVASDIFDGLSEALGQSVSKYKSKNNTELEVRSED